MRESYLHVFAFLLITTEPYGTYAGKILMFPWEQYSHVNFFTLAGTALKSKGHEVWVIADAKYAEKIQNAGLNVLSFTPSKEADRNIQSKGATSVWGKLMAMRGAMGTLCEEVMTNHEIISVVERLKFDLAIMDSFPLYRCFYTLPYKYGIPYITLGAWHDPWGAGVPVLPSVEPHQLMPTSIEMTFLQRFVNTLIYLAANLLQYNVAVSNDFITTHAPANASTSFRQLFLDSEMFLITMETTCYEYGRLSTSNYRFIGSLSSIADPMPVPADIARFMDNAIEGVVIVSFGSFTGFRETVMPTVHVLLEAFKQIKEKVVLQFDKNMLDDAEVPDNVLVLGWLPQTDLLAHKNTKVFITHGGLNGQMESIYWAVPTITLPIQSEQKSNGLRAENRGYGKLLDPETITPKLVKDTIRELIENPLYKKTIKKCSEIQKNMPSPLEIMVFWSEHIMQFGGSHLKQPNSKLPFVAYFMLDVILAFVVLDALLLYCCYRCCLKPIVRKCTKSKKPKND